MNRPPGPTDRWWPDHERSCGGRYTKIKEPAEFTAKQAKKKERELAREEKKKKQEKEAKAAPSVKQFFPAINEDNECKTVRGDTKPSRAGKNATPRPGTENGSNKKQKKEHEAVDSNDLQWPPLGFPSTVPVIFSADGDEDGYFLVGDMQALFQTPPAQSRASDHQNRTEGLLSDQGATVSTPSDASAVVDLTVSDSDASDNEQAKTETKSSTVAVPRTMCEQPTTQNAHVIEID
ncbi:unnamed protein product [Phytophthora lilii]|uniref:Unnamed protein product n=1 Tax=Phytophthora lilii TaxID=2077276 RepID=A0A9W6WRI5_9STRA|nr:unnamed protein product [Phytophthora lilii]